MFWWLCSPLVLLAQVLLILSSRRLALMQRAVGAALLSLALAPPRVFRRLQFSRDLAASLFLHCAVHRNMVFASHKPLVLDATWRRYTHYSTLCFAHTLPMRSRAVSLLSLSALYERPCIAVALWRHQGWSQPFKHVDDVSGALNYNPLPRSLVHSNPLQPSVPCSTHLYTTQCPAVPVNPSPNSLPSGSRRCVSAIPTLTSPLLPSPS